MKLKKIEFEIFRFNIHLNVSSIIKNSCLLILYLLTFQLGPNTRLDTRIRKSALQKLEKDIYPPK